MSATTKTVKESTLQTALRAYQLWDQDGRKPGYDLMYWFQAKKELCVACQRTDRAEDKQDLPASPAPGKTAPGKIGRQTFLPLGPV